MSQTRQIPGNPTASSQPKAIQSLDYDAGLARYGLAWHLRFATRGHRLIPVVVGLVIQLARNVSAGLYYSLSSRTFDFHGIALRYPTFRCLLSRPTVKIPFPYRLASVISKYDTERSVEVPIGQAFVSRFPCGSVLEIGNVLNYYFSLPRYDVLDKYEPFEGLINIDVIDYNPGRRYAGIVSISTLEHVGFDEQPLNPGKPRIAVNHLLQLLEPGGEALITVPLNYNQSIDEFISEAKQEGWTIDYYQRERSFLWTRVESSPPRTDPNTIAILTYRKKTGSRPGPT